MSLSNYLYLLFLFSFPCTIFSTKDFLLTSTNYFHHVHCNHHLRIHINSIQYFYEKSNCTLILHRYNYDTRNICSNQSSCILNLKPFLFFHGRNFITKCDTIELKSIRLNYTCVNYTFTSNNIHIEQRKTYSYTKNIFIICSCTIIVVSLFALLCSYLRHFSRDNIQKRENSIMTETRNVRLEIQPIDDNPNKQTYELKNFSLVESSSSSTLTSLNNKNIITNPSDYDNLVKHHYVP